MIGSFIFWACRQNHLKSLIYNLANYRKILVYAPVTTWRIVISQINEGLLKFIIYFSLFLKYNSSLSNFIFKHHLFLSSDFLFRVFGVFANITFSYIIFFVITVYRNNFFHNNSILHDDHDTFHGPIFYFPCT